jgi:hypothetical protein
MLNFSYLEVSLVTHLYLLSPSQKVSSQGLRALPSVAGADQAISLKICCPVIGILVLQSKVMRVTVFDCLGLRVVCFQRRLLARHCTYTVESYPSKYGAVLVRSLIVIQLAMFLLTNCKVVDRPVHKAQHHWSLKI